MHRILDVLVTRNDGGDESAALPDSLPVSPVGASNGGSNTSLASSSKKVKAVFKVVCKDRTQVEFSGDPRLIEQLVDVIKRLIVV